MSKSEWGYRTGGFWRAIPGNNPAIEGNPEQVTFPITAYLRQVTG